jgi:UDPglucose--hexose-1-phosphate uridylyltransferase
MPEIRFNNVTREWVIIATERARRPEEFAKANTRRPLPPAFVPNCPFCPGNEHMTPPERFRIAANGAAESSAGWQVRVIPNKFAALDATAELRRESFGMKRRISGAGLHDVIIETPAHDKTPALLAPGEFDRVIESYQRCYANVTSDPRVAHATLFKNHGERAGTSLEHPHSQIVGTPIIPPQVRERMENSLRFFDETGECILCCTLGDEMLDRVRVVEQNEHFAAIIPYATLTPFSMWIIPLRHAATFLEANDAELASLSHILHRTLRRIYFGLENPDFNLSVRTPPREANGMRYYHWYVSLIPRVTRIAGFEIGSGMFINTALPEQSAEYLRGISPEPAA